MVQDGSGRQSFLNPVGWFWSVVNFFYLFYQTMVDPSYNKLGPKYTKQLRAPGSGPPKPYTRKYNGFGASGSGPPPPPMGGCGCG